VSRFRRLSHTIWHCQYHIVWTPKYRFRILTGNVGEEVFNTRQEWSACALEKWATTESQNDLVIWLGNGVAKDLI
jgi:REP element-mobilizing transposase RayT